MRKKQGWGFGLGWLSGWWALCWDGEEVWCRKGWKVTSVFAEMWFFLGLYTGLSLAGGRCGVGLGSYSRNPKQQFTWVLLFQELSRVEKKLTARVRSCRWDYTSRIHAIVWTADPTFIPQSPTCKIKQHLPPVNSHGNTSMASPHQHSTLKLPKPSQRKSRKFFGRFPVCPSLFKENLLFGGFKHWLGNEDSLVQSWLYLTLRVTWVRPFPSPSLSFPFGKIRGLL